MLRTLSISLALLFASSSSIAADWPVYVARQSEDIWSIHALYRGTDTTIAFCSQQRNCEWLADAANQKAQGMR